MEVESESGIDSSGTDRTSKSSNIESLGLSHSKLAYDGNFIRSACGMFMAGEIVSMPWMWYFNSSILNLKLDRPILILLSHVMKQTYYSSCYEKEWKKSRLVLSRRIVTNFVSTFHFPADHRCSFWYCKSETGPDLKSFISVKQQAIHHLWRESSLHFKILLKRALISEII